MGDHIMLVTNYGSARDVDEKRARPLARSIRLLERPRLLSLCAADGRTMAFELFRFCREFSFSHQTDPIPDREASPGLSDLPVEILLQIRDLLPLSSSACLTLCSRHMIRPLGSHCWSSLRAGDQTMEWRRFLIVLQKDRSCRLAALLPLLPLSSCEIGARAPRRLAFSY